MLDRLGGLPDGVADEPHATQLADHVYARDVGLEELVEAWDLRAALLRPQHQGDGSDGADPLADAVADAFHRVRHLRLVADRGQDILLRAAFHALAAADAQTLVHQGVQRGGLVAPQGARLGEQRLGFPVLANLIHDDGEGGGQDEGHHDEQGYGIE